MPRPSSSCVPWSSTPPGAYRPSPISRCGRCCLQARQCLGHPETYFFRGYLPTAHSLACLRIAESVTVSGARLATGRAGSPFAGRVSHPLDDKRGFMKSSHTPFPLDQPCLVALSVSLMSVVRRVPTMGGLGRKFLHKLPDMEILRAPIKMRQFIFTHTSGPVPRHAVLGVGGVQ